MISYLFSIKQRDEYIRRMELKQRHHRVEFQIQRRTDHHPPFQNQVFVVDLFGQRVGIQVLAAFTQWCRFDLGRQPGYFLKTDVKGIGDDTARKEEHTEAESKNEVHLSGSFVKISRVIAGCR